jgi:hypothetical protein
MIRKRNAIGMLFTPSQNFMITRWTASTKVGTEDKANWNWDGEKYYYPRTGILKIKGSYIYKEFITPKEIYIYVDEEEHEHEKNS